MYVCMYCNSDDNNNSMVLLINKHTMNMHGTWLAQFKCMLKIALQYCFN